MLSILSVLLEVKNDGFILYGLDEIQKKNVPSFHPERF
jgi:hypothetical protein